MNASIQWLQNSAAGQSLLCKENAFLQAAAQRIHGQLAVQLSNHYPSLITSASTKRHLLLGQTPLAQVYCDFTQLPLPTASIDGVLLPHTLDWAQQPKQVLHEVYRILKAEGKLIITGFNPYSLWTLSRLWNRQILPFRRDCIALHRLKDWLDLLGFDIIEGCFMVYTPISGSLRILEKLNILNHAGNRWWPHGASAYGLVAIKRVHRLRALNAQWQNEDARVFNPSLAATPYHREENHKHSS